MSTVVNNVFEALEYLAGRPDQEVPLSRLADALGVSPSRCAFLMKSLLGVGAVDQAAPRRGYRLGPTIHYLARNGPFRRDIIDQAEPLVRSFSEQTGEAVVLVTMPRGCRHMLVAVEGRHDVTIRPDVMHETDVYATATGRLLLASMPPADRQARVRQLGLPGEEWPGIETHDDLVRELDAIASAGEAIEDTRPDVVQLAFRVTDPDGMNMAVGVPVPRFRFAEGTYRDDLLRHGRQLAEAIRQAIT
ncbi:MAG: hypothetical protein GVY16_09380 [Planctomycetes bacterium]|jgi:DNA-binding IclR family transcriptional regulator|nr:hypothetical protein [Phycisphaerae bacterium]NBB95935.1 hypothetical protein [Planctomycetota bacterium]